MYRLALYESWSIDNPAWEEIESDAAPLGYFASANLPGTDGFLIHGGQGEHMKITRSTLVYDIDTNEWSEPSLQGQLPVQRIRHSATSDNQGRVWIWGGKSDLLSNTVLYDNRWTVIDTSTWAYSYPDISNPPSPRVDHTATLIPDGKIIIIGGLVYSRNVTDPSGQYSLNPVSMSSLLKFDAAGSQWLNVTATGNIPAPRGGHSAVLSSDGSSIIVFGGGTIDDEGEFKTLNDIFVLELATMRWSAPSISGELPLPRKYHYARLVDESTMLVGFGLGSDEQGLNGINLLSTSTWSWISEYQPNLAWLTGNATFLPGTSQAPELPTSLSPSNVTSSDNSTIDTQGHQSHVRAGVIAGVVSGGVVAVSGENDGESVQGLISLLCRLSVAFSWS
ncbi:hypothetical protein BJV82DRAFT_552909 [Fennellomyces sp. T-0311]|nr:hypothetical protein BJV82DRAFT_552909 [Fennellomyces sp. T-0311]